MEKVFLVEKSASKYSDGNYYEEDTCELTLKTADGSTFPSDTYFKFDFDRQLSGKNPGAWHELDTRQKTFALSFKANEVKNHQISFYYKNKSGTETTTPQTVSFDVKRTAVALNFDNGKFDDAGRRQPTYFYQDLITAGKSFNFSNLIKLEKKGSKNVNSKVYLSAGTYFLNSFEISYNGTALTKNYVSFGTVSSFPDNNILGDNFVIRYKGSAANRDEWYLKLRIETGQGIPDIETEIYFKQLKYFTGYKIVAEKDTSLEGSKALEGKFLYGSDFKVDKIKVKDLQVTTLTYGDYNSSPNVSNTTIANSDPSKSNIHLNLWSDKSTLQSGIYPNTYRLKRCSGSPASSWLNSNIAPAKKYYCVNLEYNAGSLSALKYRKVDDIGVTNSVVNYYTNVSPHSGLKSDVVFAKPYKMSVTYKIEGLKTTLKKLNYADNDGLLPALVKNPIELKFKIDDSRSNDQTIPDNPRGKLKFFVVMPDPVVKVIKYNKNGSKVEIDEENYLPNSPELKKDLHEIDNLSSGDDYKIKLAFKEDFTDKKKLEILVVDENYKHYQIFSYKVTASVSDYDVTGVLQGGAGQSFLNTKGDVKVKLTATGRDGGTVDKNVLSSGQINVNIVKADGTVLIKNLKSLTGVIAATIPVNKDSDTKAETTLTIDFRRLTLAQKQKIFNGGSYKFKITANKKPTETTTFTLKQPTFTLSSETSINLGSVYQGESQSVFRNFSKNITITTANGDSENITATVSALTGVTTEVENTIPLIKNVSKYRIKITKSNDFGIGSYTVTYTFSNEYGFSKTVTVSFVVLEPKIVLEYEGLCYRTGSALPPDIRSSYDRRFNLKLTKKGTLYPTNIKLRYETGSAKIYSEFGTDYRDGDTLGNNYFSSKQYYFNDMAKSVLIKLQYNWNGNTKITNSIIIFPTPKGHAGFDECK